MVKHFFLFFFLLVFLLQGASAIGTDATGAAHEAVIYKNEACGHCVKYLYNLNTLLIENGFSVTEKSLINDQAARKEVAMLSQERAIPSELQGHLVTVLDQRLVLEGHVPIDHILSLLEAGDDLSKLVVYQDSMAGAETLESYAIMQENGTVVTCDIKDVPKDCLSKKIGSGISESIVSRSLFVLVLFNGLLAGIHPCTISVLLFFIAFLFTLRRTKAKVMEVGLSFIVGVFLAYLLIGLGLLQVVAFSSSPHLAAKIGAVLVLLLGIINIWNYVAERNGVVRFSLGIPKAVKPAMVSLIHNATFPAAFIVGLIVGACSFGCTAGIYISILSLLVIGQTATAGFGYLLLYNVMFITPLVLILLFASNRRVVEKMEYWEAIEKKPLKLIAGIIMILLAIGIWLIAVMH